MAMRTKVISVLLIGVAALSGGCAFDRKWLKLGEEARASKPAMAIPTTTPASTDPLAGRWEGKWQSEQNGHSGRLRAIATRVDAGTYHIDYDAYFMGIFRFTHGMNVSATRADDAGAALRFEGQEDIGPLAGGVYHYTGTADGQAFTSTYQSNDDHGRFEMKRPAK
jgi:hypothetical protein